MKQLSREAGLSETAVRDYLKRGHAPNVENLERIARVLGCTVGELYDGDTPHYPQIRVIGCVSAGDGWHPFDDENAIPLGTIEMSVDGEAVALEVQGDSMVPVYRRGDFIIGGRKSSANVHNYVGLDCIVETANGDRYVKFLQKGTAKGLYSLRSYNPAFPDVENVRIAWAAPIMWVKRGR